MILQSSIALIPTCLKLKLAICGCLLSVLICSSGCRSGLSPFSAMQEEPSFDRLIELESATSLNPASTHPQVTRRRPGANPAGSQLELPAGEDQAELPLESAGHQLATSNVSSARRRISDDTAHDEVNDHLEDTDPSAQLLQRTQLALKNSRQQPSTLKESVKKTPGSNQIASQNPSANRKSPSGHQPADIIEDGAEEAIEFQLTHDDNDPLQSSDPDRLSQPVQAASYRNENGQSVEQVVFSSAQRPEEADVDTSNAQDKELSWEQHLREALKQLETTSNDPLATPAQSQNRQAVIARLLALSLGDRDLMLKKVDGLQPKEQDYLNHQLTALYDAFDPEANPVSSKRWSLVMLSQRKASEELAALSNLEINNLSFCTDVESFGVIAKFPDYKFTADQEVLLYCELDNFVSEKSKDGKGFETQLQGSYEVVDASGKRVADQSLPLDSHVCRNKRRDYFIAYRIYIPQKIEPGKYSLKLTVEDVKGRKFGQSQIPFQVQ